MFYFKRTLAQFMAMSIMITNMPVQATFNKNELNRNELGNMYVRTTSGGIEITILPSI